MEPCYICLEEINNAQACYGHVVNERYYRPVNPAAEGRNAVIHAIHLECFKGLLLAENATHPNRCGCCRADLDIPEGSPLREVYLSREIQGNEALRQRWVRNFPGVAPGEQPFRQAESEGMRGMHAFIRARRRAEVPIGGRAEAPIGARENACRKFSYFLGVSVKVIVIGTLFAPFATIYIISDMAFKIGLGIAVTYIARSAEKVAHLILTGQFQIPLKAAFICGGIVMLLSVPASREVVIDVIENASRAFCWAMGSAQQTLNWYVDKSWECGEVCGSSIERNVFWITNGATRRIANMRIFQRAA